ncbi:MAG: hypothetical protein RIT28_5018, partial [Pseudomonadota bacterium]
RFEAGDEEDTRGLEAARRAAAALSRLAARGEDVPRAPSQRALLALRLYEHVLSDDDEDAQDAAVLQALRDLQSAGV